MRRIRFAEGDRAATSCYNPAAKAVAAADLEGTDMATVPRISVGREVDYPTSDGRPMAETDAHRRIMVDLIQTLQDFYAADPLVYVSGDLLLFYEEGNRRKHVAPDIFVVKGAPKEPMRDNYLLWKEGRGPDLVVEVTSKTTRKEDETKKRALYRDTLKVPEYFLFDPFEDYLDPPFQGHRRARGRYLPIKPVLGRLPSAVLGLHLERSGPELRLVDPATGLRLPTRAEKLLAVEARLGRLEIDRGRLEARLDQAEAENERLRRELEEMRRSQSGGGA